MAYPTEAANENLTASLDQTVIEISLAEMWSELD
jgi:hypothetical protein